MTSFSERLKAVRKGMGKSQAEFAEMAGVVTGSQGGYERGAVEPTASYFLRLAEMGVDMNFLLDSTHSASKGAQQLNELLTVLHHLPPAQQAMGFAILSLLGQGGDSGADGVGNANEVWRTGRLVNQFLAMDTAGKAMVELAAKGAMADLPPK
jgi:transcriptional regulator with XRE-family HTH domain